MCAVHGRLATVTKAASARWRRHGQGFSTQPLAKRLVPGNGMPVDMDMDMNMQ